MADTNTELPDTEPQETAEGGPQPVLKGTSGRKSFAKLRRELSDEELSSPAVQRMLIDEIERLDAERTELASFRISFMTLTSGWEFLKKNSREKSQLK